MATRSEQNDVVSNCSAGSGGGDGAGEAPATFRLSLDRSSLSPAAYPNNVECDWNGLLVAGADAYYDARDVWVYRPDGTQLASLRMGDATDTSLRRRSLVLSGDNTRVIGSTAIPSAFKSIPAP